MQHLMVAGVLVVMAVGVLAEASVDVASATLHRLPRPVDNQPPNQSVRCARRKGTKLMSAGIILRRTISPTPRRPGWRR